MAERKKKKGKLTAADLATFGITPKQPEKPKLVKSLVKGQEPETLDRAAAVSEPLALVSEAQRGSFSGGSLNWKDEHAFEGRKEISI
jgi:hypothetical protein